jgi:hypothetical protein
MAKETKIIVNSKIIPSYMDITVHRKEFWHEARIVVDLDHDVPPSFMWELVDAGIVTGFKDYDDDHYTRIYFDVEVRPFQTDESLVNEHLVDIENAVLKVLARKAAYPG